MSEKMKEYINARRAELVPQRDNAFSAFNQAVGALMLLDHLEQSLDAPAVVATMTEEQLKASIEAAVSSSEE